MANLLLINGPNLNLLGKREPEVYGETTLSQIEVKLKKEAVGLGHELECIQSNAESDLVDKVQSSVDKVDFILLNPGALTHTSVALRDALLAVAIPFIEIHISNIHAREEFRQKSYFSDIAEGVIEGLGPKGYSLALEAASNRLSQTET